MLMDLAQFGASGAVVVVVLLFLRYMREEGEKRDQSFLQVSRALDKLTYATGKNTEATTSADTYLKQRNGRDIEKHTELLKATQAIPTTLQAIAKQQAIDIIEAVKIEHRRGMNVERQYVEHAHINQEVVKNKA